MKLDLKSMTSPIDLGEYDEAYRGQVVHVWVGLPLEFKKERSDLLGKYAAFLSKVAKQNKFTQKLTGAWQKKKLSELQYSSDAWLARLWSQHADNESHWTVEDVRTLSNSDNVLFTWLVDQSVRQISEFAASKKK